MKNNFKIELEDTGKRIDNLLIRILKNVPKPLIYRLVRKGVIRLNGRKVKVSDRIYKDDVVEIPTSLAMNKRVGDVPLWLRNLIEKSIIHEDEHVIVVDKPAGIPSHGGSKLKFGVIETVRQIRTNIPRIDLVHRLDRATSGCLIMTKNHILLKNMHKVWNSDEVLKIYTALVGGIVPAKTTFIKSNLKIERFRKIRKSEITKTNNGRLSETEILSKISISERFTLLRLSLKTGRMHQIRAQFSDIGHPVACDEMYGLRELNRFCKKFGLNRMFLHCSFISLNTDTYQLSVESKLPKELRCFLDRTNKN